MPVVKGTEQVEYNKVMSVQEQIEKIHAYFIVVVIYLYDEPVPDPKSTRQ